MRIDGIKLKAFSVALQHGSLKWSLAQQQHEVHSKFIYHTCSELQRMELLANGIYHSTHEWRIVTCQRPNTSRQAYIARLVGAKLTSLNFEFALFEYRRIANKLANVVLCWTFNCARKHNGIRRNDTILRFEQASVARTNLRFQKAPAWCKEYVLLQIAPQGV